MGLTETRGDVLPPDRMLSSGPVNGPVNGSVNGPVNGRAPWQPGARIPCPVGPPLTDGQPTGALLAAANTANLVPVCPSSTVPGTQHAKQGFTSADGGVTRPNAGPPA